MNFFIKLIDKHFVFYTSKKPTFDDEKRQYMVEKARIVVILALILVIANGAIGIISLFLKHSLLKSYVFTFLLTIGLALYFTVITVRKKGYEHYHVPALAIIFFMMLVLPYRMFYSGGIYSSLNIYASLPLMFSGLFFGRKGLVIVFALWCVEVLAMYQLQIKGIVPTIDPNLLTYSAMSIIFGVILSGLTSYIYIFIQKYYLKKNLLVERNLVTNLFVTGVSHEINNPLFVGLMTLELNIKSAAMSEKNLNQIKKSIDQIASLVRGLEDIERNGGKFESTDYSAGNQMLKIKSK
jgi:hypothetical protein